MVCGASSGDQPPSGKPPSDSEDCAVGSLARSEALSQWCRCGWMLPQCQWRGSVICMCVIFCWLFDSGCCPAIKPYGWTVMSLQREIEAIEQRADVVAVLQHATPQVWECISVQECVFTSKMRCAGARRVATEQCQSDLQHTTRIPLRIVL